MCEISNQISSIRVSSVLNKDVKNYGKQYLLDGKDETCWNSEKGSPQWIILEFKDCVQFSKLNLQFQGGFVGKSCSIHINSTSANEEAENFYPEDVNSLQTFQLSKNYASQFVKIVFGDSSDFFGRIVVYSLDLLP